MQLPTANSELAIILTDPNRRILWVNEAFTSITGYTLPEVQFKSPSMLQGKSSDSRVIEEMKFCLHHNLPFKNEITNYRKNGQEYKCRLVVHPIFDSNRTLTNYIAFERDASNSSETKTDQLLQFTSKYQTSSLKGVKSLELYDRLRRTMQSDKLYLDCRLNLPQLADILKTNTKYLSQVVNHHYKDNLQQFVNEFRVEEAKRKLVDPEFANLTYFAIGQLCGFKNKSTFYKVFKKFMDATPHEYVSEIKN